MVALTVAELDVLTDKMHSAYAKFDAALTVAPHDPGHDSLFWDMGAILCDLTNYRNGHVPVLFP
jgi:hypothetical protein